MEPSLSANDAQRLKILSFRMLFLHNVLYAALSQGPRGDANEIKITGRSPQSLIKSLCCMRGNVDLPWMTIGSWAFKMTLNNLSARTTSRMYYELKFRSTGYGFSSANIIPSGRQSNPHCYRTHVHPASKNVLWMLEAVKPDTPWDHTIIPRLPRVSSSTIKLVEVIDSE